MCVYTKTILVLVLLFFSILVNSGRIYTLSLGNYSATIHFIKLIKPCTPEIGWECLLCYDQSHWRSGHASEPQNHKLLLPLSVQLSHI